MYFQMKMEQRNQAFSDKNFSFCQFNNKKHLLQCKVKYNDETISRFGSSRKQKQQSLEAETLNFRVLMECSNQQNLKKLKEAISLSVYKRNILVIIDKIVSLRIVFSKALVILAWFLLLLLLFLLIVYISLAFHFEVFQSELFCISVE